MGQKLNKFLLLMWKNFVLQYRRPIQTVIEILVPVVFSAILVVVRSLVDPSLEGPFFNDASTFHQYPLYKNYTLPSPVPWTILYAPNDANATKIMSLFVLKDIANHFDPVGLSSFEEMETRYKNQPEKIFAGIYLEGLDSGNIKVHLRFPGETRFQTDEFGENSWRTNLVFPQFSTPGPRGTLSDTGPSPEYYRETFLMLQNLITVGISLKDRPSNSSATYEDLVTEYNIPKVFLHRFPYPQYYDDPLISVMRSMIGLILMLSFVYSGINTVKAITTEKEKQLKEAMKIMGLPNWLHWTAWFVKCFIYLLISVILMVILLKVKWYSHTDYTLFTHTDGTVMLFFMLFYISATITFCFALSVFFSKANTAATVAGLMWFLSYFPYMLTQNNYDQLDLATKMILCLGSNAAVAFGFQTMILFEGMGDGISWGSIFSQVTPDDDFTLGHAMIMLLVDTILYLLIALYVEAVFPGEYGVPLPWYFPFQPSYWRGNKQSNFGDDFKSNTDQNEFFEEEPDNLHAGVEIRNLRKEFGMKTAVRDLSLNMYEDQITVLLGHNGAGKTTTMSMLTGMLTPTTGTARVNGYDICSEMSSVRDSLGLCPQHNIIFDDLTVSEHLYFFSKLKGLSKDEVKEEVDRFVNLLDLADKRNAKSATLSGGMKRKLSVGVALCGKSKVVMLDEPTAGMDPSARRVLWDLLQTQKEGRTMLLSTHFMDEADLLGDRIAIMAGGQLQCCGSSFFLKKKYGAGYSLIMDKSRDCEVFKVTNLLKKHLPDIEFESNIGSELTYLLPENQAHLFESMLADVERSSSELGIKSFGISLTTLEEVFMKVGADSGQEEMYDQKTGSNESLDDNLNEAKVDLKLMPSTSTSMSLIVNQFRAMFLKKYTAIIRSKILLVLQILMPTLFLLIVINVSKSLKRTGDLPTMPLSLDKFDNPVTLVQGEGAFLDTYKAIVGSGCQETPNLPELILKTTKDIPNTVRRRYIAGATFNENSIIAWFNNDPYHSPGIAVGLVMDAIYSNFSEGHSLEFINAPFPYTVNTTLDRALGFQSDGLRYAFNLGFSMSFVAAFYLLFVVRENVCKSKHLQLISGVKIWIFWLTAVICDYVTYLISIVLIIITFLAYQIEGFSTAEQIGVLLIILLCFAWAFLPLMYIAGFFFSIPSTGYTRMTMINLFTGAAAYLVVQILQTPALNLTVGDTLHQVFILIPHYAFASAISNALAKYTLAKNCKGEIASLIPKCRDFKDDYYGWDQPGIGTHLTSLICVGTLLYLLLLIREYQVFSRILYWIEQKFFLKKPVPVPDEDSDVAEEKRVIKNTDLSELQQNYDVVIQDLTKYYKKFLGVNGLSLGIKRYECFGLLGVNGAGKTTTFKMMTGDEAISYGDAWVSGFSIRNQPQQVQKLIGYCPQFDALLDDMTARESLIMFALLRGIARSESNELAEYLAKEFDFSRHLDKQVKELSGGNKRKLSTSISLIGDPPVLFLDEPTTGMDPATKRYLWNALCKFRDSGKCVVLTSHSMEECEALCTRLAIMVNGNFKCLGSTQHLKNKFAKGYTLTVKVKRGAESESHQAIEEFVRRHFPGAQEREKHQELISYYITDSSIPCSKMFGIMERGKRGDINIEDYSLGQSSLEQVFLTFAKQQTEL